jgi:ADP-ribose pyrophosphatase YjhB (NUDIX family)
VWGTFGGGVDEGESLEGALKRELFEEGGYTGPMVTQPLYVYCDQKTGFRYFNHLAIVPKQFDPVLNFETSEVSWFTWPSAPSPLHPGVKTLFADPASRIVIESVLDDKPVRGTQ